MVLCCFVLKAAFMAMPSSNGSPQSQAGPTEPCFACGLLSISSCWSCLLVRTSQALSVHSDTSTGLVMRGSSSGHSRSSDSLDGYDDEVVDDEGEFGLVDSGSPVSVLVHAVAAKATTISDSVNLECIRDSF